MATQDPQYAAELETVIRQYQELGRLLPQQQAAVDAAATGIPNFKTKIDLAGKAAVGIGKAFSEAAGAVYKGQKGLKAFDGAIDGVADALMALSSALFLVSGPMKLLAVGLRATVLAGAEYVKAANEQSDQLYTAFQKMSKSGGSAADGLQGLYNDVQKLGGGIQDLGDFVSLVSANASEFASFGGNVYQGRKEFAKLSKEMEPFREELMNAGMSQQEINEAAAGYVKLQSRVGRTQNFTTEQLAVKTKKYLIEQDRLTKLTGMTRKEQEDSRAALRNQERFGGKLFQLRNRGMDDAATALENTVLMLQKDSQEVGQGLADLASGNMATEAAQKLERATQGEARRVAKELSEGLISEGEAADRISLALKRNLEMYGETQTVTGNYNATFGDFGGQMIIANRQLTGGYQKQLEIIDQNNKVQGVTGTEVEKELKRQTQLRLDQQKSMQNTQDFVRMGVGPATEVTSWFAWTLEKATSFIPGAGKFTEQYEQEKKDRASITAKEKSVADAGKKVLDAKAEMDGARNEQEAAVAKEKSEAAQKAMQAAMVERDNLQQTIDKRKGIKAKEVKAESAPELPPPVPSEAPGASGAEQAAKEARAHAMRTGSRKDRIAAQQAEREVYRARAREAAAAPLAGSHTADPTTAGTAAPAEPTGKDKDPLDQVKQAGLKIRPFGDVYQGGLLTDTALNVAKSIQTTLEKNFGYFTGLNDIYHQQKHPNSSHAKGRGIDFTLSSMPTPEQAQGFKEQLQKISGVKRVYNEYFKPPQGDMNQYTTGPHFHIDAQARDGGIFDGPRSGYPVTLHGHEAVIPLKNGAVPMAMPKDATADMSQVTAMLDQFTLDADSDVSSSAVDSDIGFADPGRSDSPMRKTLMQAKQIVEELQKQNRLFENVVAAHQNTTSISQKILQTSL